MVRVKGTIEEQIQIEEQHTIEGRQKFKEQMLSAVERGEFDTTPYGRLLITIGTDAYTAKLEEYFNQPKLPPQQEKTRRLIKLLCDDPEILAAKILGRVIALTGSYTSLTRIITSIKKSLTDDFVYGRIKEDNPKLHTYLGFEFERANAKRRKELIEKNLRSLYDTYDVDTTANYTRAITTLLNILENSGANIIEIYKTTYNGNGNTNALRLTEEAQSIIEAVDGNILAEGVVNHSPLVVPPRDWTTIDEGGYYVLRNRLIGSTSKVIRDFQYKQNYDKVIPIINKLQKTGWRVNLPLLDLIQYVYQNNIPVGNLPSSTPTTWRDYMSMPEGEYNKETWAAANKKRQQIQIKLDIEFSRRIQTGITLGTAENYKKYEAFYYTYRMDYRGRVYPTTSSLNHQQGTIAKVLLEFSEGQYLTPDGLRWLKIHLANVYGLDKLPYEERVAWVDNNYDLIMRIAEDALGNMSELVAADSPFEFVAACLAYKAHYEGDKVHLPIQLDATCSGIQFYSGLLRDEEGAKSVNVIGRERNDIYMQVADRAEEKLLKGEYDPIVSYSDSEGEVHTVLADGVANSIKGFISRKIVKRPTMTVPYSVTKRGMQQQIRDELTTMEEEGKAFWDGDRWVAAKIITDLVSTSIYEIIDGAKKGQEYLVDVSKVQDTPSIWYTPIYDYPVHQNALEQRKKRVRTIYGSIVLRREGTKLNRRKHSNSIAPNFIHSMDSTVLLGVIDRANCDIGIIHDCFMVPPNSGYEVQEWYRDSFVKLMEADPLRRLQQQIDPMEEVEFPEYGSLELEDIYDAEYIIS